MAKNIMKVSLNEIFKMFLAAWVNRPNQAEADVSGSVNNIFIESCTFNVNPQKNDKKNEKNISREIREWLKEIRLWIIFILILIAL